MAGKKGQIVQLQLEVNTEEQWQKLLEKDGLTGKNCDKHINFGSTLAVLKVRDFLIICSQMFRKPLTNYMQHLLIGTSVYLVIILVCVCWFKKEFLYKNMNCLILAPYTILKVFHLRNF
jgi:hypothetical protein